jgi:diguanylate cyclase (GGDEF)-like protein/PAS domain S-box-containing protein
MPAVPAPLPANEAARLAALHRLRVLDTLPEQVYDDIVHLAAQLCGTPIGLISLVDGDRQWFKARVGLPADETPRDMAFCAHAIAGDEPLLMVEDATRDARFDANPLVTGDPGIRFYAGAPIVTSDGHALGTVCVIDTAPNRLTEAQVRSLQALARQATALLYLRLRTLVSEEQSRALERLGAEADEERRRSAEMLDLVLRGGNLGLWDLHVPSGRFNASPRECEMLGHDLTAAHRIVWRELLHPEDRAAVDRAILAHLAGETAYYQIEHRLRHADGRWIWVLAHAVIAERAADGSALRIVGTHLDVTERKLAERALGDSQRRLRLITDSLPAMVAHIDGEQRYRFLSGHVQRTHGIDTDAALGRTMREVRGDAVYADLQPHVEAALRGQPTSFVYTERVGERTLQYQSHYVPDVEAGGRVLGFYAMTFDITELRETQARLEQLARIDPLTGLPNRRQFDERIREGMARARRLKQPMAVMFLDIDRFKWINDSFGHAGGDAVLCEFARRLRESVRITDTVARFAGDEFVLLLEGVASPADLDALADKVVRGIRPPFEVGGLARSVTTSAGVAVYDGASLDAPALLAQADRALYRAKQAGRDRYVLA